MGATSSVFVSTALVNGDIVTCKVANNDVCANSGLRSVTMSVHALGSTMPAATSGGMSIFPDPNKGSFFVKGLLTGMVDQQVSLTVTNMVGQIVYRSVVPVSSGILDGQINCNNIPGGPYTLNIYTPKPKIRRYALL